MKHQVIHVSVGNRKIWLCRDDGAGGAEGL